MPLLVFPPLFLNSLTAASNVNKNKMNIEIVVQSRSQHSRETAVNESYNFDLCFQIISTSKNPSILIFIGNERKKMFWFLFFTREENV